MIKCMNLSFWMFSEEDFNDQDFTCCYEKEIKPILNRDGWYLDGNKCWFEYEKRAFLVSKVEPHPFLQEKGATRCFLVSKVE